MHADIIDDLSSTMTASLTGSVVETVGMTAAVADFPAPVGAVVRIDRESGPAVEGDVVGFRDGSTLVICSMRRPVCGEETARS
jgi:hypothetical protein